MTLWQIIRRSWVYYWQIHVAMILAVALTTAVLSGALTVGDSMRGSLRQLTLDRLGPIDRVLLSQTFFAREMVEQWKTNSEQLTASSVQATPTIHFPAGTLERTLTGASASESQADSSSLQSWTSVEVWGLTQELQQWQWATTEVPVPEPNEIVVNRTAAQRMGLQDTDVGQLLTLRIGKPTDVPAESFIASKDDSVTSLPRLKLKAIVADKGLGRLALTPGTDVPALAFLNLDTLRRAIPDATLDAREGVELYNALLLASQPIQSYLPPEQVQELLGGLKPALPDVGLKLRRVNLKFPQNPETDSAESVLDYYNISSDRMLIDAGQQSAIEQALAGIPYQRTLTYLANEIRLEPIQPGKGIPFSMVTALGPTEDFDLTGLDGKPIPTLQPGQIVLNQWAANDLNAGVGDTVQLSYYEPETVDGDEVERTVALELVAIAGLTAPKEPYRKIRGEVVPAVFDQEPTVANDPWLTPEVPGVTDAASIDSWNLPFQTDVRPVDDDYWQNYRTTPKAFVSMEDGVRLWNSRFGTYTGYRVKSDRVGLAELRQRLRSEVATNLTRVGFQEIAAKQMGLAGSKGSTPFDVLFLMFSMFVIAASLMLSGLFFRLGMQQRSRELGLWLALGFSEKQARRFWIQESIGSTAGGIVVGSLLGIAYAWTIAYLMRTAWVGAVASPFLYLHWSWVSLLGGAVGSLVVSLLVIWWSIRQATGVPARALLSGGWNDGESKQRKGRWWHACLTRRILLGVALLLSVAGFFAVGDTQAVVFLAGGFCALTAVLMFLFDRLVGRTTGKAFTWSSVAQLNLSRQPLRSMIIVSLVGLATFLIVAVSAFRLAPTQRGTAGFEYVATTDVGVQEDIAAVIQGLESGETAADLSAYGFRFHDGEHASCNNPFQARLPQVLGVDDRFIRRFDSDDLPAFAWVGTSASDPVDTKNPWRLLDKEWDEEDSAKHPVPVVMDKNTAWYSLKVYMPGNQFTINFPDAGEVTFELVGLLDNAVMQGVLLIGDRDYVRLFPTDAGKRYFLLEHTEASQSAAVPQDVVALGKKLKPYGWQIQPADEVLANYMAVQNTYLSAFQSLGSLGLLLGTIGLIVAQYRSLLERRSELALFQALGFPRRKVQQLITSETVRLILNGFLAGLAGALVCVLPHWISGAASVPWLWLAGTLGCIMVIGLVASVILGRIVMQGRLVSLLRTE